MDYNAASFELTDRPLQEDFLTGIGFAYALALLARVIRFATWFTMALPGMGG